MSIVAAPSACANCAAPIHGRFCAECGQKATPPDPTLHDLLHEFLHEVVHLDGKIFQSIKLLYTRPGLLTREYCDGRRARHVGPLRLYLTLSVLAFALLSMEPPPKVAVRPRAPSGNIEFSTTPSNRSGFSISSVNISEAEAGRLFQEALHVWLVGSSRVDLQACKLEYSIVSPK